MPARHVVVDGSNIATEGSSLPTLKQLDEAVREFLAENPDDVVTVVVDATFGHRIPSEERARFEQAELEGDVVSPPAGAVGRGDAFLLRVADKVGAAVLSNDSFQEFHGEYEWLFDKGRLIGGKPVPGVGWIFTPRSPVRGPKSRESVKEAKRKRRVDREVVGEETGLELVSDRPRGRAGERKLQRAIATATEEVVEPDRAGHKRRRRRRAPTAPSEPLNEPFAFISFIAAHQLGDEVIGTVEEFSSHGAFISVGGARCYLPLSAMANPPPRSAREALKKGEKRNFVVQAFDAIRRGVEVAVPGFARISGRPTPETVDAEIERGEAVLPEEPLPARRRAGRVGVGVGGPPARSTGTAGDGATKKAVAARKARAVPSGTATKRAAPAKATVTKATAKKAAATKAAATKAAATKAAATKATPPKTAKAKAAAAKAPVGKGLPARGAAKKSAGTKTAVSGAKVAAAKPAAGTRKATGGVAKKTPVPKKAGGIKTLRSAAEAGKTPKPPAASGGRKAALKQPAVTAKAPSKRGSPPRKSTAAGKKAGSGQAAPTKAATGKAGASRAPTVAKARTGPEAAPARAPRRPARARRGRAQ